MSYGRHPLNPIPLLLFAALPPPPPLPPLGRAGKKAFFSLHGKAKQQTEETQRQLAEAKPD